MTDPGPRPTPNLLGYSQVTQSDPTLTSCTWSGDHRNDVRTVLGKGSGTDGVRTEEEEEITAPSVTLQRVLRSHVRRRRNSLPRRTGATVKTESDRHTTNSVPCPLSCVGILRSPSNEVFLPIDQKLPSKRELPDTYRTVVTMVGKNTDSNVRYS